MVCVLFKSRDNFRGGGKFGWFFRNIRIRRRGCYCCRGCYCRCYLYKKTKINYTVKNPPREGGFFNYFVDIS